MAAACVDASSVPDFVGRRRELDALRAQVELVPPGGQRVVLISGEAGVGKSRLAAELVASLGRTPPGPDDDGPRVEVVEDVHLLDESAIAGLGRSNGTASRLVVATMRAGMLEAGSGQRRALLELRRRPEVVELELPELTVAEVAELLGLLGVDDDPAIVHDRAGGNPFFVQELVRSSDHLPWTVREMIAQQLHGTTDADRQALTTLAVAAPVAVPVLRTVVPSADLAMLLERRLVRRDRATGSLSLHHGVVEEELRSAIDSATLRTVHQQVADALERAPDADPADLWRHRLAAGDRAGARRAAVTVASAAAADGHAQRATTWFERGLEGGDTIDPEVLGRAATVAGAVGRVELAERWARAADHGFRAAGRDAEAERMWSDRSLRYIRRPGATSRGGVPLAGRAEEAELAARAGDVETARALATQVLEESHPLDDSDTAARAALALYMAGDPSRAIDALKALRNEAFDAGEAHLEAWREGDLAACSAGLGDIAGGIGHERAALTTMADLDDDLLVPSLHVGLACLLGIAGELEEAKAAAADLAAHPSPFTGLLALVPDMIVAISEDEPQRALRNASELAPFKEAAGPYLAGIVLTVQAYAYFMSGDHEAATAVLDELDEWVGGVYHQSMPIRLELRMRIAAAAGDAERLRALLERATALAEHPLAGPGLAGNRALATGLLHRVSGDPGSAVVHLRLAADHLERAPRLIPAGLTWCDAASAALDHGDPPSAQELLGRAEQLRDRGLRGLGEPIARVRQRVGAIELDLTPRERQLLSLLAAGMTNQAMADELFLSARTVRNQLHALFQKLGVSRRAEAAALAVRLGLTDGSPARGARPGGRGPSGPPHDDPGAADR